MHYTLVGTEDGSNITVFASGRVYVAHSSHPNFDQIVTGVVANDESVVALFDAAQSAATKFQRLTERVTTANGRLYLDGEEVHDALAAQVVRFLNEGVDDWEPLVLFFENVQNNPNEHSREQLYSWLDSRDFTITPEGLIVGYKGVATSDGAFVSIHSGKAIVNGEVKEGRIPNAVGSVIEMPRGEVQFDPSVGCHTGLHVGTYEYAESFADGALLEVHVNPRDVVSVPTDCEAQKMRVCRYTVVDTIDAPHTSAVRVYDERDDFGWGDGEDDGCLDCDDVGCEMCLDLDDVDIQDVAEESVSDLEDNGVKEDGMIGTVWEDRDSRRQGRTFKVESIEGDYAVGKSLPQNVTRKVRINRLMSHKYRKVS